jgi:hypothetical protein
MSAPSGESEISRKTRAAECFPERNYSGQLTQLQIAADNGEHNLSGQLLAKRNFAVFFKSRSFMIR